MVVWVIYTGVVLPTVVGITEAVIVLTPFFNNQYQRWWFSNMYDVHPKKLERRCSHIFVSMFFHIGGEKLRNPPTSILLTNQSMRLKQKHLKW